MPQWEDRAFANLLLTARRDHSSRAHGVVVECGRTAHRTALETTAAVGTRSLREVRYAVGTPGALERADQCLVVFCEVTIAALTVRPKFQHGWMLDLTSSIW
jgi:hypothetical protein